MERILMFVTGSVVGYFTVLKIIAYKKAEKEKEE